MGRAKRADESGGIYHMLNRANRRATIFQKDEDYHAFERILAEALDRVSLKLFSYCRDAQPLASGRQSRRRRGNEPIRSVARIDAHAVQCSLPHDGRRLFVPRSLQIVSHSRRRSFPLGMPLCRTQRVFSGFVQRTGAMAVWKSFSLAVWHGQREIETQQMAGPTKSELGGTGSASLVQQRAATFAVVHETRLPVW